MVNINLYVFYNSIFILIIFFSKQIDDGAPHKIQVKLRKVVGKRKTDVSINVDGEILENRVPGPIFCNKQHFL